MEAIRLAVLDFNTVDPAEQPWHRRRLALILSTPALQAHSTIRYTAWRKVVNEFVAYRLGVAEESLTVQTIGYTALGAAVAAYEVWLGQRNADLLELLDSAFRQVADGFSAVTQAGEPPSAQPGGRRADAPDGHSRDRSRSAPGGRLSAGG
jgi:hypothetical protein